MPPVSLDCESPENQRGGGVENRSEEQEEPQGGLRTFGVGASKNFLSRTPGFFESDERHIVAVEMED